MKSVLSCLALLALLTVSTGRAGVAISFDAGEFYDASGTPVPDGSLVLLISSTLDDNFGSLRPGSLSVGSFIDGADDLILARAFVDYDLGAGSSVSDLLVNTEFYSGWNTGDSLALVWFSTLDAGDTTLTLGTAYGYYSAATPLDDSDPWLTPESGTINLRFLNDVNDGSYDSTLFRTNLVAIPEPATYAMIAGLAMFAVVALRRRRLAASTRQP